MQISYEYSRQVANHLENVMLQYGYTPVETPIIEESELFLRRAGDQIIEKLFTFERFGRHWALRPEFTTSAAHLYATRQLNGVARWQFRGAIFEDSPFAHSPDYQRYSAGAEMIGVDSPASDAETLALAIHGVQDLIKDDWVVKIGNISLIHQVLNRHELDARTKRIILNHRHLLAQGKVNDVIAIIDHYTSHNTVRKLQGIASEDITTIVDLMLRQTHVTMGSRTREDIAQRLLNKHQQAVNRDAINAALHDLKHWMILSGDISNVFSKAIDLASNDSTMQETLHRWKQTLNILQAYDVDSQKIIIQPDLMRNWDYYTGIVFEIATLSGDILAGGGRYDELIGLISQDNNVPAIGFVYNIDVILQHTQKEINTGVKTVLLKPNNASPEASAFYAHQLRKHGFSVKLSLEDVKSQGNTGNTININEDGTLTYGQQRYTQEMLDKLAAEIKRHDA